jgi:sn-glycerol 3-phosphate transport system ATP-binding protein
VLAGLRPEDFEAAPDGPVLVRIELLERLGADTILHGRMAGNGPIVKARIPGAIEPAVGATLRFAIRPERIHLFDPESGRRLGN